MRHPLFLCLSMNTLSCVTACSNDDSAKSGTVDTSETSTDDSTDTSHPTVDTEDTGSSQLDTADTSASTNDTAGDLPKAKTGLLEQTLVHDEVTREYLLYVPASYDGSTELPVLMNFHGFGGFATGQMKSVSDMRELAESEQFLLVYPQGTLLDGFSHWNTYLPGDDNKSEADDFGFIDVMLETIASEYAVDSTRVYATGYSNGGDFTYTLACYLSEKITGIAPVSGLMWVGTERDCTPSHPTALISLHGTSDSDRPYEGWPGYLLSIDDSLEYWNDHNDISSPPSMSSFTDSGKTIERYDYEGGTGDVAVTHYKVIGGGHIWFNLSDGGTETNQLIWNFLSQFNQDGSL